MFSIPKFQVSWFDQQRCLEFGLPNLVNLLEIYFGILSALAKSILFQHLACYPRNWKFDLALLGVNIGYHLGGI